VRVHIWALLREPRRQVRRTSGVLALLPMIVAVAVVSAIGSIVLAADVKPGEGLVVFTRKNVMKGKAIQFNIEQDGRPIGQLRAGTTLEVPLAPGTYNFTVRAPSLDGQDFLSLNVQAGKIYNVRGKILWGWPTGRPKFEFISESTAPTSPAQPPPGTTDALAGPALGAAVTDPPVGANQQTASSVPELGHFIGDWNLQMWSLAADGTKLEGRGVARGKAEDAHATQIVITEFEATAFPEATGGGRILIANTPDRGLTLESDFRHSDDVLRFFGQYEADAGKYVFYLVGTIGGQTATGIPFSSVRVEIHSLDKGSWIADTYSTIDGESTQVQSYRFTRR